MCVVVVSLSGNQADTDKFVAGLYWLGFEARHKHNQKNKQRVTIPLQMIQNAAAQLVFNTTKF